MRRYVAAAAALALVTCAAAAAQVQEPTGAALRLVRVASGLDEPTQLASTPSEPRRRYVVERAGRILAIVKGRLRAEPFLDIRDAVSSSGEEQGLLSLAFHPDYARNHRFYVDYTNAGGDTEVVEYRSDGLRAIPSSRRVLLEVDQPYENHNGGQLAFGPDGRLHVGMGDGGSQGDPQNHAQDLSSRLGKVLAIDVEAASPVPGIVVYGVRNPWRFSFDRETGDLWIADVGGGRWEEVDVVPRSTAGLVNLGWPLYEGDEKVRERPLDGSGRLVFPVAEYGHDEGCAIIGGFVYRGKGVPDARGRYFYGDHCSGAVWSLVLDAGGRAADIRREPFTVEELTSFGEGPRGELFLVSESGDVYRLGAA